MVNKNTLGAKTVVWPRRMAERSDMKVWPRLIMHLR